MLLVISKIKYFQGMCNPAAVRGITIAQVYAYAFESQINIYTLRTLNKRYILEFLGCCSYSYNKTLPRFCRSKLLHFVSCWEYIVYKFAPACSRHCRALPSGVRTTVLYKNVSFLCAHIFCGDTCDRYDSFISLNNYFIMLEILL